MKGIVFNLLEAFVVENWGQETYESLLDGCPVDHGGVYVGPGTYPDVELFAIVKVACKKLDTPAPQVLRAFGAFALPKLIEHGGPLLDGIDDAQSLLSAVHDIIHVEVRKVMPGAKTPHFTYLENEPGRMVLEYRSDRKLCHFLEGLLDGLGTYYGETIEFEHATCMHDGAECCTFELTFVREPVGV